MVSKSRIDQFIRATRRKIALRAMQFAPSVIPNRTLRAALKLRHSADRTALHIPHYWAIYVHDGRGPFGPRRAKVLVWFNNPEDDPRTGFGTKYPVRYSQVVRLTREQYLDGLEINRIFREEGKPDFMNVAGYWPNPTPARPFFSKGMLPFLPTARKILQDEFAEFLAKALRPKSLKRRNPVRVSL